MTPSVPFIATVNRFDVSRIAITVWGDVALIVDAKGFTVRYYKHLASRLQIPLKVCADIEAAHAFIQNDLSHFMQDHYDRIKYLELRSRGILVTMIVNARHRKTFKHIDKRKARI